MITKVKPDTILNNVWPAIILANSRIDKLKDLNMYDINSITTNKGANPRGAPEGAKKLKKLILWLTNPIIVTPIHIVNDSPNVTIK